MNSRRRRVTGWLSRALILFMVPVVWLAGTPELAAASQSEILKATLQADWIDNASMFGDADCTLPIGMGEPNGAGAVSVVVKGAYCYAGPDFTPAYCWGFESGCSSYSIAIMGDGNGTCASADLVDYAGENDGMTKIHTRFQEVSMLVSNCDPVEVCITGNPTGGGAVTACVATSLDVEEAEDAEGCLYTNYQPVPTPRVDSISVVQAFSSSWRVILTIKGQMPGPESGSVGWRFYVHGVHIPGNDTTPIINGGTTEINTGYTFGAASGGESSYTFTGDSNLMNSIEEAEQFADDLVVAGLGMYLVMPGDNPGALNAVPLPNGANPSGKIGISNPNRCAYYWGDKIADYGAPSPYDEPIGPVLDDSGPVDVPVPPEPEPEPEPGDDDGSSWWGWLGELLKLVISAVKGVIAAVGKIAGAILDGLGTLFVPENTNAIKSSVNGMKDSFDGKFPFSLAEEMQTLGSGMGGGCPDWRVKVGNDVDKNIVCDSSFTGAIRGARGFILAGMLALAFWPLMRGVFYASVPVLKPTPVGGK